MSMYQTTPKAPYPTGLSGSDPGAEEDPEEYPDEVELVGPLDIGNMDIDDDDDDVD